MYGVSAHQPTQEQIKGQEGINSSSSTLKMMEDI
jgi:hypothetical protein